MSDERGRAVITGDRTGQQRTYSSIDAMRAATVTLQASALMVTDCAAVERLFSPLLGTSPPAPVGS
jgi:hypothetical protein